MPYAKSGYNTDDIHEQSTIQANVVTTDLKHVYYVMGGYLFCYSISREYENQNLYYLLSLINKGRVEAISV